jgi:hypothetical protein
VGSAVGQTARQIGGAIGVAVLVVFLGTPHSPAEALTGFDHLWTYAAIAAAVAGLICCLLTPARKPAPAPSGSEAAGSAEVISVSAGGRQEDPA